MKPKPNPNLNPNPNPNLTRILTLTLTLTSYRSMDRSLTDDEINALQNSMRERAAEELAVELR